MRPRTLLLSIAVLTLCCTSLIFLYDALRRTEQTSEHQPSVRDRLKKEAEVPFLERNHRLERRPRLEAEWWEDHELAKVRDEEISVKAAEQANVRKEKEQALRAADEARQQAHQKNAAEQNKYHIVVSVDGGIYTEWQVRICYYWYKKTKEKYPASHMGGFTRLLHGGVADDLMDEIPTAVVSPLPAGVDEGYVVLNRPYAFLQWVHNYAQHIPEDYVIMAEPDHIFIVPPPLWASPIKGAAFPFTYIEPQKPENAAIIAPYNTKHVPMTAFAPIGNAPVMIHKNLLEGIVDDWYSTSLRMKKDPKANTAFGWILEMYAYSIASAQASPGPIQYELHVEFALQPPFDSHVMPQNCIIHYTYGLDYDEAGNMMYGKGHGKMYHFDKRDFQKSYLPKDIPTPPEGVRDETARMLIGLLNEATNALKPWPKPR